MELQQFLGFLAFLGVFTLGFWMMFFLIGFVIPYWIFGYLKEEYQLKRAKKKNNT